MGKDSPSGWKQNNQNISTCSSGSGQDLHVSLSSPSASLANTMTTSITAPSLAVGGSSTGAGEDSDHSDFGNQQSSASNSRSQTKKLLKNFKQLPQEEVVLQSKYNIVLVP